MFSIKRVLTAILLIIVLIPLWMWFAWLLTPKKKMVAAIIDKTVLTSKGQEHVSFSWLLNNNRFAKTQSKLYHAGHDYFGFFPKAEYQYELKGLERFSLENLDQLSDDADLTYFTDTYGIYKNEWYTSEQSTERSGLVYGGMSKRDVDFLQLMKDKHKLILSEFNTIGSPTPDNIRAKFETMFGMRWSGWTARYFPVLDTVKDKELPLWLINNYKRDHQGKWPFHKAGIAFVSSSDKVVILEEDIHLSDAMTYIRSREAGKANLDLPDLTKYPFWFDIIVPDKRINTIAANFEINTTSMGRQELKRNGIPTEIPAVIYHKGTDYQFYYFSGDFCDNPVSMTSSYFKGIDFFSALFYNSDNKEDRSGFFWRFYYPMMDKVLSEYYSSLKK
ncbi:hypothetical protein [Desertivirga arenae]|uniref:hypothetical protein n=1 Tax=Desertivirga arenae TaxID=2810309 RepID=UPI001A97115E|nr:hypothetical protein [Pedobacter sp. SYSU D00823]